MFFSTNNKTECFGCEACKQICPVKAIEMLEDEEGFRYPLINSSICINCGFCNAVCPKNKYPSKHKDDRYLFGGYVLDSEIRFASTSGGAFSAIVDAYCDEDYVIFGAESTELVVSHNYVLDKEKVYKFRKSKYVQSHINSTYLEVASFLVKGKKVLFSGTPCQIAGLLNLLDLKKIDRKRLLTIDVVCEGVPSPLYIRRLNEHVKKKYNNKITKIDYRYTGKGLFSKGKWDFEQMRIHLYGDKYITIDRWFNPFWKIWLDHLMTRPSCYECCFAKLDRVSDITLGDLWGVHVFCPELYGDNGGSSLVMCNTEKGKKVFDIAKQNMFGHELDLDSVLKYQSPLKKSISKNTKRDEFISDLRNNKISFNAIIKKWYKKPSLKLLWSKYIYGNRQKVLCWRINDFINRKDK